MNRNWIYLTLDLWWKKFMNTEQIIVSSRPQPHILWTPNYCWNTTSIMIWWAGKVKKKFPRYFKRRNIIWALCNAYFQEQNRWDQPTPIFSHPCPCSHTLCFQCPDLSWPLDSTVSCTVTIKIVEQDFATT